MRICAFTDEAGDSLKEQIDAMLRNEIRLMEIRGINGKNISDLTLDEVKEVKKQLDANGLAVWSIGSPTGKIKISDDFEPHFEAYKKMIEKAHILEVDHFRMFSFFKEKDFSEEKTKEIVYSRLEKFISAADGITLCHENEKEIYGDDSPHAVELAKAFPQIKAVYDPANYIQVGEDSVKAWKAIKPFVEYIHIKDCNQNGAVVPPGIGIGRISEIIKDYLAGGGDVITVEPHLAEFTGLNVLENGSTQSNVGHLKFSSNSESFDYAVKCVKEIIKDVQ